MVTQDTELCSLAIKHFPTAILFVKDVTPELAMLAVTLDGSTLAYVKEQTQELCLAAVKQMSGNLVHVRDQSEFLCLAAIESDWSAIQAVREQTEKLCGVAIGKSPKALMYIKSQTEALCLEALKVDGGMLAWVTIPYTPDMYITAVKTSARAAECFKSPSRQVLKSCYEVNKDCLAYLPNEVLSDKSQAGLDSFSSWLLGSNHSDGIML